MLTRDVFEQGLRPLFENVRLGTTTWSPILGGILSGKYNDGTFPPGSRIAEDPFIKNFIAPRYFAPEKVEGTKKIMKGLADLAKELNCT
jgi:aryl-alcohol dehydrogenase-like predicted oxidoreductase